MTIDAQAGNATNALAEDIEFSKRFVYVRCICILTLDMPAHLATLTTRLWEQPRTSHWGRVVGRSSEASARSYKATPRFCAARNSSMLGDREEKSCTG